MKERMVLTSSESIIPSSFRSNLIESINRCYMKFLHFKAKESLLFKGAHENTAHIFYKSAARYHLSEWWNGNWIDWRPYKGLSRRFKDCEQPLCYDSWEAAELKERDLIEHLSLDGFRLYAAYNEITVEIPQVRSQIFADQVSIAIWLAVVLN